MKIFKIALRIAFATGSVLNVLTGIISFMGGPYQSVGIFLFWFNLIEFPLFIAFFFVLLYKCIFKRKQVPLFKTELIYLLIQICAWVWLSFSCPNC
jgi:hypothetical protein